MSPVSYDNLYGKLTDYKKKYYGNLLLRGCIVSAALLLTAYLCVNTLEYFGQFNPLLRGLLFFAFVGTLLFSVVYWIADPLLKLYNLNQPISDEEAALQIGKHFTQVNDKLLNAVQLRALSVSENELLQASIQQKTQQLGLINFSEAVNFRENQKYLKYVIIPLLIILSILLISPRFFAEFFGGSSVRIVNFSREYVPAAPFSFLLKNSSLTAFKNEDLTVKLDLRGQAIPETAFIVVNERKIKMNRTANGSFAYTFSRVQNPFGFSFEAAGFNSVAHQVKLIYRPSLLEVTAAVTYPAYLSRANEKFTTVGNLIVPEGSQIEWQINAAQSDSLLAYFNASDSAIIAEKQNNGRFVFGKRAQQSQPYQIRLKNRHGYNKEEISYNLEVIPDQFPKIAVEQVKDTSLFSYIVFGGSVSDDYGLTRLSMHYKVTRNNSPDSTARFRAVPIGIQAKQTLQNFYYQWDLKPFKLAPGDKIEYFAQVWDNDGVNGSKSTRSANFTFQLPSKQAYKKNLEQVVDQTEGKMSSAMKNAEKLNQEVNNLKNRLKTKKSLDFKDKKALEELINKREEMMREIESLRKQVEDVNQKRDRFQEPNSQFAEKVEKLQKLMDDLLDEETKKLYEELQKMLEQNRNNNALDLLDKIDKKESNFEKEIERVLEMFKQLQFEQKLDQNVQELKQLSEAQQKLSEQSLDKKPDEQKQEDLQNDQQELSKEFEDIKKSLEELKELNKNLEQSNPMENTQSEEQKISEAQQKSLDQLQKENNKKASEAQKNASEQMKSLADKLAQMQSSMGMEQQQENMDHLRDILENLITLSFDQEQLMKDFRNVYLSDPRFVKLSQQQLKLKDDAKIIEDSLYSLAKRVFQIESFVTREVSSMKEQMDGSTDAIKQRRLSVATGKQQLAMTSMNNLALLLNDVLKQMQEQMANAQAKMGQKPSKGNKPSSLSQLQQQLNQQIQQLQKGNQSGRGLSEELAKLSAQQELIRRALKEMEKGAMKNRAKQGKGEDGGGDLQELMKKMEETEKELVNKNLNTKTINRQKEILTRLLDSEKAMKEQEEEQRREAEQAKEKERKISPTQFNEYIKMKEKQTELLNTIPPALSPYYRKEVDKYFKKIN